MPEVINCPRCSAGLEISVIGTAEVHSANAECKACGYRESATDWSELDAKRALYEKIEEEVIKRANKP